MGKEVVRLKEKTWSVREVARILEVSAQTVYNWIDEGKLQHKEEGVAVKRIKIPDSALRRFLNERGIGEDVLPDGTLTLQPATNL
jgi:excisionase family DNA binding protein